MPDADQQWLVDVEAGAWKRHDARGTLRLREAPEPHDSESIGIVLPVDFLLSALPGRRKIARQRGPRRPWSHKDNLWNIEASWIGNPFLN